MSAREIYEKNIRQLSPLERLRLALLILEELAADSGAGLDLRDDWSDQDIADLSAFSLKHAAKSLPPEDGDA